MGIKKENNMIGGLWKTSKEALKDCLKAGSPSRRIDALKEIEELIKENNDLKRQLCDLDTDYEEGKLQIEALGFKLKKYETACSKDTIIRQLKNKVRDITYDNNVLEEELIKARMKYVEFDIQGVEACVGRFKRKDERDRAILYEQLNGYRGIDLEL